MFLSQMSPSTRSSALRTTSSSKRRAHLRCAEQDPCPNGHGILQSSERSRARVVAPLLGFRSACALSSVLGRRRPLDRASAALRFRASRAAGRTSGMCSARKETAFMDVIIARFTEHVDLKPEGSITLGFADLELLFEGSAKVDIKDCAVRLNADGIPVLRTPSRAWEGRDGETRYSTLVRVDEVTYRDLVRAVFTDPRVQRAVHAAEEKRATAA